LANTWAYKSRLEHFKTFKDRKVYGILIEGPTMVLKIRFGNIIKIFRDNSPVSLKTLQK